MPYDASTEYLEKKNAQVNQPINLYTIEDYDGAGTNLYFAEYKTDVVFDGITYSKSPMSREETTENTTGEIDATKIRLANVSRAIQYYVENYDLTEKKVTIKQVWADTLADTDNVRTEVFYIDRYTVNDKVGEFECTSKFDVQSVELPFGRYMRGVCRWKEFKDSSCGYAGAETTCDRTLTQCRARSNELRFGAFPSIPTQTIVVA